LAHEESAALRDRLSVVVLAEICRGIELKHRESNKPSH
jgi:hypothetical protein